MYVHCTRSQFTVVCPRHVNCVRDPISLDFLLHRFVLLLPLDHLVFLSYSSESVVFGGLLHSQAISLSSGLTVGHSGFFGHFLPGVLLVLFLIGCLCLSVLLLLNHAEFLLLASLVVAAIVKPENLVLVFASISLLTSISALSVLGFSFSPVRSPVFLLS